MLELDWRRFMPERDPEDDPIVFSSQTCSYYNEIISNQAAFVFLRDFLIEKGVFTRQQFDKYVDKTIKDAKKRSEDARKRDETSES